MRTLLAAIFVAALIAPMGFQTNPIREYGPNTNSVPTHYR
jgi:hypothetical protein